MANPTSMWLTRFLRGAELLLFFSVCWEDVADSILKRGGTPSINFTLLNLTTRKNCSTASINRSIANRFVVNFESITATAGALASTMELREFELWPQQRQWIDQQQRNGNSGTGSETATANRRGRESINDADRSLKRINPDP